MLFGKKKKKEAEQIAAQKAAEQKAAEQKAVEQKAAEQKAAAHAAGEKAGKEAAERAAAQKRSEAAKKAAATRAANKAEQERLEKERLAAIRAEQQRLDAIKGYMVVKPAKDGRFVYVVVAGNQEVIAKGAQTYASASACRSAVASVAKIAKAAAIEDQTLLKKDPKKFPKFEIYKDKSEKYRFRLFASNGQQLLACTQGYAQKTGCKGGIQSVIVNCEGRIETTDG